MSTKKKEHHIIREQFGRYLLLDHLVDGGMAKICRAKHIGEQAEKIVAIKMIQSQFSKDESFRKMFEDEVKVSFGLQHPNIAQTNDYGMMNGQLYTAMEYVDGKNLKQFMDELKKRKVLFPIEVSTYIISLACQGLHYAHTYTDKLTGEALNLVHRDVSPHNIMLAYDGAVKVIDFGIAKATTNADATQAGTIKGKLSYLAPEYLEGTELDGRYDEFTLGIVLWEMLCSRKLFHAANELAVLKEIQKCKIPAPSVYNPTVPKELDQIVLKALSKDRNQRYENLDQFNRALTKFLYSQYENFNSSDLGKFASALFKKEIEEDRILMREFGKINVKPYLENLKNGIGSCQPATTVAKAQPVDDEPKISKAEVFDFNLNEHESVLMEGEQANGKTALRRRHKLTRPKAQVNTSISNRTRANINIESSIRQSVPPVSKETKGKRTQTKTHTKSTVSQKIFPFNLNQVASILFIAVVGIGGLLWKFSAKLEDRIVHKVDISKPARTPSSKVAVKKIKDGKIQIINFENFTHEIFLDGKLIKNVTLGEFSAPLNKELILRVQKKDYKHFVQKIFLDTQSMIKAIEIPEMEEVKYAYLITSDMTCLDGKLTFELFDEKRREPLPIRSRLGIPIPLGISRLTVIRDGEMVGTSKEISVKKADEVIDLCEQFLW